MQQTLKNPPIIKSFIVICFIQSNYKLGRMAEATQEQHTHL